MKSITDIKVRLIEEFTSMIRDRKEYPEEYYEKKYSMYEMELDRLNLLKWVMGIDNWHNDDLSNITLEHKLKPLIERTIRIDGSFNKREAGQRVKYLNRLIKEAKSFAEHREKYPDWYDDEGNPIVSKSKQGGA